MVHYTMQEATEAEEGAAQVCNLATQELTEPQSHQGRAIQACFTQPPTYLTSSLTEQHSHCCKQKHA